MNVLKRNGHEEATSGDPATAKAISRLIELPRAEFEQLVVDLYCALGHDARRTGGPGDRDFDIVIVAKSGQHWIAQCKQWRGAVGESVVREFYAAMAREHATEGAIITTARFTPKAIQWAQGKSIHLYDGPAFLQILQRIKGNHVLNTDTHG
ncbi:MAG TPA: restriction endonuclease [Anaerolineae bacterium]|nr:restriction endonuclease [Anaerolineae bacterium]